MASAFVHAPVRSPGGIPVEEWLRRVWDAAVFAGVDTIQCDDGSEAPVEECALLFRSPRPAGGRAGAYTGTPVAVVPYRDAMLVALNGGAHASVRLGDIPVPLGTPARATDATTMNVLLSAARLWCSGGKNDIANTVDNVVAMYYAALQALVFEAGSATTAEGQARWFPAMAALTRAFAALHTLPEVARITEAMVVTPGVEDMLQKALAHVFHAHARWDAATVLDMLALMLRRGARAGTASVATSPGPAIVLLLVPLLRHAGTRAAPELAAEWNATTRTLADALVAAATAPPPTAAVDDDGWVTVGAAALARARRDHSAHREARMVAALAHAAGVRLPVAAAARLLAHCATTDASAAPPWASWGVLPPPPALVPRITTGRYALAGRRDATFRAVVAATSDRTARVVSYKGVEWAAVSLHTPGRYTCTPHNLGVATAAVGDSRGAELAANWRVTVGDDVLPPAAVGFSSAGMAHVPVRGAPRGTFRYVPRKPVAADAPFTLVVTPASVSVQVDGDEVFGMQRDGQPALLAFKNLWLEVAYDAGAGAACAAAAGGAGVSPAAAAVRAAPTVAAAAAAAAAAPDLPPTALLARVHALVEASSGAA